MSGESIGYERFSAQTRRVLAHAEEEARQRNHAYIGAEHFLLGIVREPDSVAARILSGISVGLDAVRFAIVSVVEGNEDSYRGDLQLTPAAKSVIKAAVEESRSSGGPFIGTEHLLIGIMRSGESGAAGVLESLGASLDMIRIELGRMPP